MPSEEILPSTTTADPRLVSFGAYYYRHDCGMPYERNDHWERFFGQMAERIVSVLHPTSVLDAGCAIGMLVEALRHRGVDARGIDISEWAIENVPADLRPHCRQASLTEPLDGRYDLITCIEVLEHISPPEDSAAIANLCRATDRILFSSSPHDYSEPTHVNVRRPEDWATAMARHGFIRDLDFDGSFITPWAALYVRAEADVPDLVRSYERRLFHAGEEISQLRSRVLEIQERLEAEHAGRGDSERLELRHELLTTRDELVGARAQLGVALGEVQELEDQLRRYQAAVADISGFKRTPVWAGLNLYVKARRRLGALRRRILSSWNRGS